MVLIGSSFPLQGESNKSLKRKAEYLGPSDEQEDEQEDEEENEEKNEEENVEENDVHKNVENIKNELKEVYDAIKLDKLLPVDKKQKNRHLSDIKENYPSFFDEDSGNTDKEGLQQVREFLSDELKSHKSQQSSQIKGIDKISKTDRGENKEKTLSEDIDEQIPAEMPS